MTDKQKEIAGSKSEHKQAKADYEAKQEESSSGSNSGGSGQQEAVERAQSWADLNKDERKELQTADPDVTKKSFNKSTGYRAEEVAIQKQDADPLNTKWSEMSGTYRGNVDKSDHKQARKDAGTYTNDRLDSYNVDSLDE